MKEMGHSITFHFPDKSAEPILELKECGDILVHGKVVENDKDLVDGLREWLALGRTAMQERAEAAFPCVEEVLHSDMHAKGNYSFCPYCGRDLRV
jgi:hypothetical protein